jgi:hypothetical protein
MTRLTGTRGPRRHTTPASPRRARKTQKRSPRTCWPLSGQGSAPGTAATLITALSARQNRVGRPRGQSVPGRQRPARLALHSRLGHHAAGHARRRARSDRGERQYPAGDHQPPPRIVQPLDAGQRPVVTDRGEGAGRERHHGGDGSVPPGRDHKCGLCPSRRSGPAHPVHAAPRPHRASPSLRRTKPTRADRGWNDSALPAASARMGDAPGAKLNW